MAFASKKKKKVPFVGVLYFFDGGDGGACTQYPLSRNS